MIRVVRGELADAAVDAVLRPVSAEWEPVTPAMRRLEQAAGEALRAHCARLGELPVGSAAITPAGAIAARFMVHAIVRSADEPVSDASVRRALQNGLRRLQEWGLERVALPPLGTGAGNLDAEDAARLLVETCYEHAAAADYPTAIDVHVESDYEAEAFARALAARALPLLSEPDDRPLR